MRIAIPGLLLALLLCGPALARPRDDVMINVYRCAGHVSTRVWLDCYYGAAQPQRAALGLPPAPAAQVQLIQAPPAPGVPQDAAARDAAIVAAARCGGVAAERPWLDCYYAAANPVRAVLGLASMPPPASTTGPRRKDTGFFGDLLGAPEVKTRAQMASYRFDLHGFFTVVLDNGEVWRQLDGDNAQAHWSRKPGTYLVTITDGALGSFNLRVKGEPASYKVRRAS